ncbi:hypothetical protein GBA65_21590 (plasmid) [Rubrobacter marinus]|uniref:Undecaprenyl-diphosphatase n=1 Tax=Rubrobacter marinus TaxID=2653852 RepID=A0A6G8Q3K7_9ACTN|nr:hypothetical protein GBA65_21590 [Rubrobacter marinus]
MGRGPQPRGRWGALRGRGGGGQEEPAGFHDELPRGFRRRVRPGGGARPGVSRSGATITLGLFLGLRREEAARFSFLLSVPIVVGAGP